MNWTKRINPKDPLFVSILSIAEGALASSPYCTGGKCYQVVQLSTSKTRDDAASDCE